MPFAFSFRRLGAVSIGAALLLTGCESPTAPDTVALSVREIEVSHQRLAGAEAFTVHFKVDGPAGRYVKAYGLTTPYETVVRPLNRPLTMAIPNGWVSLEKVYFGKAPRVGNYPFKIWLINEAGQVSNTLTGNVWVQ